MACLSFFKMPKLIVALMLLSALPSYSLPQSEKSPELCCRSLNLSSISKRVAFPNTTAYDESIHSYYGINAQLHPTCIVRPLSAQDVSVAIQTLTESGRCRFAIRSGGHSTPGTKANIQPGVTIDLSLMNTTTYNPDTETTFIQPGARWSSVYSTLSKHNVMVPGGRTSSVGVGGFLLGGGISFHAARVGVACDSITSYEIGLASGEIIKADRRENPDLFKALKGGSNNLGIVTMFEVAAFPEQDIWGGGVAHEYNPSILREYISAGVKFTDNISTDPYAAWVGTLAYTSTTDSIAILSSLTYTKPVARPDAFRDFYAVPNITDSTRITNMLNLTTKNLFPLGYGNVVETGTYLNREDVFQKVAEILNTQRKEAKTLAKSKDFTLFAFVQPWVPSFWKDSEARGGNVLGLERFDQNMLNVAWFYIWDNPADDDLFYDLASSTRTELDGYAMSTGAYNEYIYLNYAGISQTPIQGYGPENVLFLEQVARKYDPESVFQRQVPGGFKLEA